MQKSPRGASEDPKEDIGSELPLLGVGSRCDAMGHRGVDLRKARWLSHGDLGVTPSSPAPAKPQKRSHRQATNEQEVQEIRAERIQILCN